MSIYPYVGIPIYSYSCLKTDGEVDPSLVLPPNTIVSNVYPDGKMLAYAPNSVVRLNSDGSIDPTFSTATFSSQNLSFTDFSATTTSNIGSDEKILIGGNFTHVNGIPRRNVVRLNSDGSVDTTLPDVGMTGVSPYVMSVAVQGDGKLLIAGDFAGIAGTNLKDFARINSDGTADPTFVGPDPLTILWISQVIPAPGGKIYTMGAYTNRSIARLNTDGTLDSTFTGDGYVQPRCALQPDEKLVCTRPPGIIPHGLPRAIAIRFNTDGTADPTFTAPKAISNGDDIDVLPDGKMLVSGTFYQNGSPVWPRYLVRLNSDGSMDNPKLTRDDFDGDLKADISVYRPSNNTWYILGSNVGFHTRQWGAAGDKPVAADFDGDTKTDVAVFRPSNGSWYVIKSSTLTSEVVTWGEAGDIPLAADYDADRRADYMIYRPSTNKWFRLSSKDFTTYSESFGSAGDTPMVGDFDGDFKTDLFIVNSASVWLYNYSFTHNTDGVVHGTTGDIKIAGDFLGAGKTQPAVFRPSTGEWLVYGRSSPLAYWGQTGDIPVAADYDGDGKTDPAVFRPSNNTWYIIESATNNIRIVQFGEAGDVPIPNLQP